MERPQGSLISFMSNMVKGSGGINCAQGIPGFNPPAELLEELARLAREPVHQYPAGSGNLKLREIIINNIAKLPEFNAADNVLVTNGATEAISLIYLYLRRKKGSLFTTLAFSPVYESYSNLPKIYGDRFIEELPGRDGSFDFALLENRIVSEKVDLILLCTPGNPLGKIWKKHEILQLYRICREHGAVLVVDAVYSDLYFSEAPYLPYDLIDDNLFVVSAFSKMLSITGWRVGYMIGSKSRIAELAGIHDYTGLCSPSILQEAIANYLTANDTASKYLESLRKNVRLSFFAMRDALQSSGFKVPQIDGGYFVWAELPPKFRDGFDFAISLYENERVGTVPGIHFSEHAADHLRISIAKPVEEIGEAAKRICRFVCGN